MDAGDTAVLSWEAPSAPNGGVLPYEHPQRMLPSQIQDKGALVSGTANVPLFLETKAAYDIGLPGLRDTPDAAQPYPQLQYGPIQELEPWR
jgi:hypothetical protein